MYTLLDTKQSIETYRSLALYMQETPGFLDDTRAKPLYLDNSPANTNASTHIKDLPSRQGPLNRSGAGGNPNTSNSSTGSAAGAKTTDTTTTTSSSSTTTTPSDSPPPVVAMGGTNSSMLWRSNKLASGFEYTLIAKLDMDCFYMDTYLINGAALKITMKQTSPEFRVIQPDGEPAVQILLTDLTFHPYYIHLTPDLIVATEEMLKSNKTVLMPFTSQFLDSYTIAPGQ